MSKKYNEEKKEAREEIITLLTKADKVFRQSKTKANNYIKKARKLAMKYNIRIKKDLKRKICKHCYSYLKPGFNVQVRTQPGRVVVTCKECNKVMRYVY